MNIQTDSPSLHRSQEREDTTRWARLRARVRDHLTLYRSPTYRRPSDLILVIVGAFILLTSTLVLLASRGQFDNLDFELFRIVNALPGVLEWPLRVLMQLGSFAAVPLMIVLALLTRRFLLVRNVALGGVLAWFVAKIVKVLVGRGRPTDLLQEVIVRGGESSGLGFPSGHVTIAATMATVVTPYLGRWGRVVAWGLVALVGLGRMYVGAHFPIDVLGGVALGILLGGATNLLLGVPRQTLDTDPLLDAFQAHDIGVKKLEPVTADARSSVPYVAQAMNGERYIVKLVGDEQRNADFLFKVWRAVLLKNVVNTSPFLTPKQQVEHEAYITMLAKGCGISVPDIVFSQRVSPDFAVLVQKWVDGTPLDEWTADDLSDELLHTIWEQVRRLHEAHVAHGDLRCANVLVGDEGTVWFIDFGFADAGASEGALAQDTAQMLASLAEITGCERAVASAIAVLGPEAVARALPALQPIALSSVTRNYLSENPEFLDELQETIAEQTGEEPPEEESVLRVQPQALLWVLGLGVGLYLLLPQIGELHEVMGIWRSANPLWLSVGLAFSLLSYVAATASQLGAVLEKLSAWRTFVAHFAATFANRFGPRGVGGAVVLERFMEKSGLSRRKAITALAVKTLAGSLVHGLGLVATLLLLGESLSKIVGGIQLWQVGVVLLVLLAVAIYFLGPEERRDRTLRSIRSSFRDLKIVLQEPRQALALFGGAAGVTGSYIAALVVSLWAVGSDAGIPTVAAVYLAGEIIGSASPTPGGIGVLEGALVAGLVAFGVPSSQAVAGVLLYRLLTFWLPILPGLAASRYLQHEDML